MSKRYDRVPSYIHTYTGRFVDPLDLKVEDVCIEDIAHALANQCRFSGHTKEFYSVAQHAVMSSYLVAPESAFDALHHDDAEAYIQDMAKPLKNHEYFGKAFRGAETRIEEVLAVALDVRFPMPADVKAADITMLVTEARDLMHGVEGWTYYRDVPPLEETIVPWSPRRAKQKYLARHESLVRVRDAS